MDVNPKNGGTKHFRQKKQKIKFYRRALRTLKNKHFKTKAAKSRKQRRLNYLSKKLKTLTNRKRNRGPSRSRSRSPSLRRTRRISSMYPISPMDNYVSPRIISIHPTQNALSPTPSILRLSELNTPSSITMPTVEVAVPTETFPHPQPQSIHSSMATEVIPPNSMSMKTDKSISTMSLQEEIPTMSPPPQNETGPASVSNLSPTPASLHLSQLGESPQTQNSLASAKTTKESV